MADARAQFAAFKEGQDRHRQGEVRKLFGTKEDLRGNYLYRMAGAVLRRLATPRRRRYPVLTTDSTGSR